MKLIVFMLLYYYVKCQYPIPQPKPEKCYGTTELLTRQCCIFPPFFKREIAKGCGARFAVMFIDRVSNVTGLRREAGDSCDHWKCILKKYMLLTSENYLDDEKYFIHLDKWVGLNPDFSTAMLNAKIHCKQQYRMFMPFNACEFHPFQSCIRNHVNVNCPVTLPTRECDELKQFYDECREFYL